MALLKRASDSPPVKHDWAGHVRHSYDQVGNEMVQSRLLTPGCSICEMEDERWPGYWQWRTQNTNESR